MARRQEGFALSLFAAVVAALVGTLPVGAAPIVTVDCNQQSLSTTLAAAAVGATVRVSGVCTGQFTIDRNLTLVGVPTAKLDGAGGGTTLTIVGFNKVHLSSLTITGGKGSDGGGIKFSGGGSLTIDHVQVTGNRAIGGTTPGSARGGGMYVQNPAFVAISHSSFTNNHVSVSGANAEFADGGGIYMVGQLTLTDSVIGGNTAHAESSNNAGLGEGAGIFLQGSLTMTRTTVKQNTASGTGPEFGIAHGGGLMWIPIVNNVLQVAHSTFSGNRARVNVAGESDAEGGAVFVFSSAFGPSDVTVTGTTFDSNEATARSSAGAATVEGGAVFGSGSFPYPAITVAGSTITNTTASADGATKAEAQGGGIWWLGALTVSRSAVRHNAVSSHSGTNPATGGGGGIYVLAADGFLLDASTVADNSVLGRSDGSATSVVGGGIAAGSFGPTTVRGSTISTNHVTAHAANGSSEALGGGLNLAGTDTSPGDRVLNSTIYGNTLFADGNNGPDAAGGGIQATDKGLVLRFDTVAKNSISASGTGSFAGGGGIYDEVGTNTRLEAVIVAFNDAATGKDCTGAAMSRGFNLFSTLTGCGLTATGTDRTSATPKLGPLAANGGPTKTVALLAGSPALDRVPAATCHLALTTDQRGVHRPQGPRCDAGAYERKP